MSTTKSSGIIWAVVGIITFLPTGLVALYFAFTNSPGRARTWGIVSIVLLIISLVLQLALGVAIFGALLGG